MPEHRIQLRRAWDAERDGSISRADLPATWAAREAPDRLSRRFQKPGALGPGDSLTLEFASVEGLRAASLNGVDLGPVPRQATWESAIVDPGARAFRLVLDLDPASVPLGEEWGRIALVIRS